ncbi:MAG: hypothetical protein ACE361_07680 [Aureliella sp.]
MPIAYLQRASEQVQQIPPKLRLLLAATLVCFVAYLLWTGLERPQGSNRVYILGQMNREQMIAAESALALASLGDFEFVNNQLRVPSDQKLTYIQALHDADAVPKNWRAPYSESLQNDWFDTSPDRDQKRAQGKEQALEDLLKLRPNIAFAAVTVDQSRARFGEAPRKSCCIRIRTSDGSAADEILFRSVAAEATAHFADLDPAGVVITDISTGAFFRAQVPSQSTNPLLAAKLEWEQHYRQKILTQLASLGAVQVMVDVGLDPTISQRSERLRYEPDSRPSKTTTRTTTIEEIATQASQLVSGSAQSSRDSVPAHLASDSRRSPAEPSGLNRPATIRKTTEQKTDNVHLGQEATVTESAGFVPRSIQVSIGIPESYYEGREAFQFPRASAEDSHFSDGSSTPRSKDRERLESEVADSVRKSVAALLGSVTDASAVLPVEVYTYADSLPVRDASDTLELPVEKTGPSSPWLPATLFALISVAFLVVFRGWNRKGDEDAGQAANGTTEHVMSLEDDVSNSAMQTAMHQSVVDSFNSDSGLQDETTRLSAEISEFVEADPSRTHALVQDWLRKSA